MLSVRKFGEIVWQERLMAMTKAVASATAALVMAAKEVSDASEGQDNQNRVIDSARQCGLATSQLVACTKVLAPTIASSPECQEQFADAVKQVASFIDDVIETAEVSFSLPMYVRHADIVPGDRIQPLCVLGLKWSSTVQSGGGWKG